MKRIDTACYGLVASAFVLTALLLVQVARLSDQRAHAEMVVTKGTITMVTTVFRSDSEVLYVLDSKNERLLAYMMDPNKKTIELLPGGMLDLAKDFDAAAERATGGAGRPGTRPKKAP